MPLCTGRVRVSSQLSSVLGLNPTKAFGFSVEGWFTFNMPFRKTGLSNGIYGNSSDMSSPSSPGPA